jgi:uncharacterized membrane protein
MDERVGLVSALLLAFSPFHLFYSQEARAYTTSLFFISVALLFFAMAMKDNSKKNWCIFGLFSGLAVWSHFYVALLIVFLFGVAAFQIYSKHGVQHILKYSQPLFAALYVFVLSILPLLFVLPKLFASRVSTAPAFGFMGPEVFFAVVQQFGSIGVMWSYLMVVLFIIGIFTLYFMQNKLWVVLVGSVVWVGVITFLLSYRMPVDPRYLIYMLPIYFTGIAVLVIYKSKKTVLTSVIDNILTIAIFAIVLMSIVSSFVYFGTNSKEDWRGVGAFMERTAYRGDAIVLVPGYDRIPFEYYYNNTTYETIEYGVLSAADLDKIKSEHPGRIWYVMTGDIRAADPDGDTLAWMEKNTRAFANYNGVILAQ